MVITRESIETTNPGSEALTDSGLTASEPAQDQPKPAFMCDCGVA